jgi:DNA-binding NarL/FixJ family response regulator
MSALRVVLADDHVDFLDVLDLAVTVEGHEVVGIAHDGVIAVDVVGASQPDLLLLDLNMPTVGGLEALPAIRAVAPRTRVVVLTGFRCEELADAVLAAGADGYLVKGDLVALRSVLAYADAVGPSFSAA